MQLRIPRPCPTEWNALTEQAGGRFCSSCGKVVADLTGASDQELLRIFSGTNAPRCARFDHRQLDRVLRPSSRRASALPIAAFTSLLAVLTGCETLAPSAPAVEPPPASAPQQLTGAVVPTAIITPLDTPKMDAPDISAPDTPIHFVGEVAPDNDPE